jgi:hypothetical protein
MKTLLAITLASFLAPGSQTQQTSPAAPASIEGQVLKGGTREPLESVTVELVRAQAPVAQGPAAPASRPPVPMTFKTERDGRFRIQNIPPGEYRLYGTHSNGYSPAEYGQRSPSGLGMPLILTAGQSKTGITLSMVPTASISGRVTDGNREPSAFASMLAFRIVYRDRGVRTVEVVQSVLTDDRGEYRLFWLVPGTYYLSALPIQARPYSLPLSFPSRVGGAVYVGTPVIALRASETGEVFDETYLPMYYPGSLDIRGAKPIVLSPGENLRADFNVGPTATRTLRVSGTILDEAGQPLPNARIDLAPRRSEGHSSVVPVANADARGVFSIRGIVPGSYFLYVTSIGGMPFPAPGTPPPPPPPPGTTFPTYTATIPLDVGSSDINNLKIQAVRAASIPWAISFEPRAGADPTPPALNVSLTRDPDLPGSPPTSLFTGMPAPGQRGIAAPERVIPGVGSGDYRVNVGPLPKTGYVKSIRLGNIDVLKEGLHISGPVQEGLEIVVSANGGELDGVVLDLNRQPFSNATIVLLPDASRRTARIDLIRNTTSNEEGKFHFDGLAPGEYKVFAWEDIPAGAWYDPDFMPRYEARGAVVLIDEAKVKALDVRVIPAERSTP